MPGDREQDAAVVGARDEQARVAGEERAIRTRCVPWLGVSKGAEAVPGSSSRRIASA